MKIFNTPPKFCIILLGTIILSTLLPSCGDDDVVVKSPVIESFTPTSALPGATVTISGNHFSTTPASNQVSFNAVAATVTSATATELVVTVPATATTGKISVTVNGKTAISSADFTVLQTTVTGFSPASGPVGTSVTISGTNFSATPSENTVKFNGVTATVTNASATELTVTVPETATSGKITVTVNGKATTSSTDFVVLQTTVTGFSPESGTHGATVTITGTNFSTTLADNIVKFNGVVATVSSATSTELTVTVPAEATTGKITVTVDEKTATSATDFAVPAPTVASYFPPIAAAGISVAIAGTNFSPVTANNIVKFNGVDATVTAASSTQLTVTVPASATAGPITVKVGPSTATASGDFEICSASPELVISDVVVTNTGGATAYNVAFKVTNVGAANADLLKMSDQNYASTDNAVGNDLAASGYSLGSGGALSPGQSFSFSFSGNIVGGNTSSHPYLIITLFDSPDGSISECNVDNNIVIKPFN